MTRKKSKFVFGTCYLLIASTLGQLHPHSTSLLMSSYSSKEKGKGGKSTTDSKDSNLEVVAFILMTETCLKATGGRKVYPKITLKNTPEITANSNKDINCLISYHRSLCSPPQSCLGNISVSTHQDPYHNFFHLNLLPKDHALEIPVQ